MSALVRFPAIAKAAFFGALVASLVYTAAVAVDARLHASGGPLDFTAPGFALLVFAISLAVGFVVALLALGAVGALAGAERLRRVPGWAAPLIGAGAGWLLTMAGLALLAGSWNDGSTLAVGALYGACVAGFFSHFLRRL